jgi:serine/threonine protein kinase
MKQAMYQQVKSIFLQACDLADDERPAFLDSACGGDETLRSEVERMLAHDVGDETTSPLDAALDSAEVRAAINEITERRPSGPDPDRIGPYRIVRRLGEGGMGIVYEAEQDQPRRRVALKVVKPLFATPRLVRRFEFEVQVLGQLEHPGIARIYDAGMTEGVASGHPFFAMELIEGQPLTRHVRESHYTVEQRLGLVARICDAVHHAHQRGVVHRDLKPANILVVSHDDLEDPPTRDTAIHGVGQPKILDFGVAKAVASDIEQVTAQTDAGQLLGTVPYMSPEQIEGDAAHIDVRSDVYSLGVILYELLADQLPHDVGRLPLMEAARVVKEESPTRLGTIRHTLRGDIETIVHKSLAKDRDQRYQSAAELGSDIRRYLRHEPITARPASAVYQLRKFAQRHRAVMAGIIVAVGGICAGAAFAGWQAITATQARDEAVLAQRRSEAVNEFLVETLAAAMPTTQPDPDITMLAVVGSASATLIDHPTAEPMVDASIHDALSTIFQVLGRYPEAEVHAVKAVEILEAERGPAHEETLRAVVSLAELRRLQTRYAEAEELARRAYDDLVATVGEENASTLGAMHTLGLIATAMGRDDKGEALLKRALAGRTRVLGPSDRHTIASLNSLGSVYTATGEYDLAIELYEQALDARGTELGRDHPDTIVTRNNLASTFIQQGRLADAIAQLEAIVRTSRVLFGDEHYETLTYMNNLAGAYYNLGRLEDAQPLYEESFETGRRVLGETHRHTLTAANNLAGLYQDIGRLEDAERLYLMAYRLRRETLGLDHRDTLTAANNLGRFYQRSGRFDEALPLIDEARRGFAAMHGEGYPAAIITRSNYADLLNQMGRFEEALPHHEAVVDLAQAAMPPDHWFHGMATARLGIALVGLGQVDAGKALLVEARAHLVRVLDEGHDRVRFVDEALAAVESE